MAARTKFKPDVTVGELLVLCQLAVLQEKFPGESVTAKIAENLGQSSDSVRHAINRINAAVGSVEVAGNSRRTLRASERGYVVGRIGWIADALIQVSADPSTDQSSLDQFLEEIQENFYRHVQTGQFRVEKPAQSSKKVVKGGKSST